MQHWSEAGIGEQGLYRTKARALRKAKKTAALPDWIRPQPGLFVALVAGESMNRRIPNGAWCLFRANPAGTREERAVVVQHRSIADPDTGGRYTVKRYSSEKVVAEEGGWRHQRITVWPDSDRPAFEVIVIDPLDADEDLAKVAEMLMLISEGDEQNGGRRRGGGRQQCSGCSRTHCGTRCPQAVVQRSPRAARASVSPEAAMCVVRLGAACDSATVRSRAAISGRVAHACIRRTGRFGVWTMTRWAHPG